MRPLLLILFAVILPAYAAAQAGQSQSAALHGSDKPGTRDSDGQRFTCNVGYKLPECLEEIAILRKVVRKYPLRALGQWNWILVKTADWKSLIATLGISPNSPALTCPELKETFVEEAIVTDTGDRTRELLLQWKMKQTELLNFAVAHEMAHGICNDINESHANDVAAKLQAAKPFACRALRTESGKFDSAASGSLLAAVRGNK